MQGSALVSVVRTGNTNSAFSVIFNTTAGTATASLDYTNVSGRLSFASGQTVATFSIPIVNDVLFEQDETVILVLTNDTPGVVLSGRTSATLIIVDDDGGILTFSQPQYDANENGTNVTIKVNRVGGAAGTIACSFQTENSTAIDGRDYVGVSGTLVFGPGESNKSFAVTILNNGIADGDRTITLRITNFVSTAGGLITVATARINDDEEGLDVSAQANIYGSGHASAPNPAGSGGGILPPVFQFVGPGVFTFGAMGQVSYNGVNFYGADGAQYLGAATDMESFGGISGIVQSSRTMFLVGVFLSD